MKRLKRNLNGNINTIVNDANNAKIDTCDADSNKNNNNNNYVNTINGHAGNMNFNGNEKNSPARGQHFRNSGFNYSFIH